MLTKLSVTHVTFERIITNVRLYVYGKIAGFHECLCTNVAHIKQLISVRLHSRTVTHLQVQTTVI